MSSEEGLYPGISAADYHADRFCPAPSLSSSLAVTLLQRSPLHAWIEHPRLNPDWHEGETTSDMDVGTLAHAAILEPHLQLAEVIDAKDWRTSAAKELRDDARARGMVPILARRHALMSRMIEAARPQIERSEIADVFRAGDSELTGFWQEGQSWCRMRLDRISADRNIIVDLKITGACAEPGGLWGHIEAMGYDIRAAFYVRGVRELCGTDPKFIWAFQEDYPPYAMSFVGMEPSAMNLAMEKVDEAIHQWQRCTTTRRWPAYPNRVAWLSPPAYAETKWLERQEAAALVGMGRIDPEQLERGLQI